MSPIGKLVFKLIGDSMTITYWQLRYIMRELEADMPGLSEYGLPYYVLMEWFRMMGIRVYEF